MYATLLAENRGIDDPDLFEGDMILTPEQRGYAEMGLDVHTPNRQSASIKSGLWPGGLVVYEIERALGKVLTSTNNINKFINQSIVTDHGKERRADTDANEVTASCDHHV